ncbi:MAG: hypothetical protein OEM01_11545 [Desulfobulbaceae bacterium]|nr:hypothetical protein [Desulfobulbaceae bacterium]
MNKRDSSAHRVDILLFLVLTSHEAGGAASAFNLFDAKIIAVAV